MGGTINLTPDTPYVGPTAPSSFTGSNLILVGATGETAELMVWDSSANGGAGGYALVGPATTYFNTAAHFGNSIARQGAGIIDPYTPNALWVANNGYAVSNKVLPTEVDLSNGYVAKYPVVTTPGISGPTEPLWFLYAPGETIVDGTVVWTMTTSDVLVRSPGYWLWAQQLSGNRLQDAFLSVRGGVESHEIIVQVYRALAHSDATWYVFGPCWENDYGRTRSLATIQERWDNWVAMLDDLRARGKKVVLQTPLPVEVDKVVSSYVRGDGAKAFEWLVRAHYEYAESRHDVLLVPVSDCYISSNPATPVWPTNTTYQNVDGTTSAACSDGTHPGLRMHFRMAMRYADVLREIPAPYIPMLGVAGERDQLAPNPRHYGTGGMLSGVTGVVSDTHRCVGVGGATAVASIIPSPFGGEAKAQRLVCTTTAATGSFVAYKHSASIPLGNFAVGDLIQFRAPVRVLANPVGFARVASTLTFSGSTGSVTTSVETNSTTSQSFSAEIIKDEIFDLLSLPVKIPPGTTGVILEIDILLHGTDAAVTVDILPDMSIFAPQLDPLSV